MKAALIVNGKAGSLAGLAEPRASLEAALRSSGFVLGEAAADDCSLDAQWACVDAGDAEIVFVAGGDGTLRDAAARLVGGSRIFAPLPGGTMNRVCARLGLPGDPIAAAAAYRPGPIIAFDVATANGEVFLYQSIVGAPTRLMRFREMQRGAGPGGWLPLLRAMLRELGRPASRGLAVRIGARRRALGHAAVVTLPGPGDAGELTLDLARPGGMVARLRQAIRWFRGELGADGEVTTRRACRIAVHGRTRGLRLSLDGEMRVVLGPVRFRFHPAALRVLAPTLPT